MDQTTTPSVPPCGGSWNALPDGSFEPADEITALRLLELTGDQAPATETPAQE